MNINPPPPIRAHKALYVFALYASRAPNCNKLPACKPQETAIFRLFAGSACYKTWQSIILLLKIRNVVWKITHEVL